MTVGYSLSSEAMHACFHVTPQQVLQASCFLPADQSFFKQELTQFL